MPIWSKFSSFRVKSRNIHKETFSSQQVTHHHLLIPCKTLPLLTTDNAQHRNWHRTRRPAFLQEAIHRAKGQECISFGFSQVTAYLLSFSGLSSQLFFNSLEAHKDPMGFVEQFSQDLRVHIYIFPDNIDKRAAWHHL